MPKSFDELLEIAKEIVSLLEKYQLTEKEARHVSDIAWTHLVQFSKIIKKDD